MLQSTGSGDNPVSRSRQPSYSQLSEMDEHLVATVLQQVRMVRTYTCAGCPVAIRRHRPAGVVCGRYWTAELSSLCNQADAIICKSWCVPSLASHRVRGLRRLDPLLRLVAREQGRPLSEQVVSVLSSGRTCPTVRVRDPAAERMSRVIATVTRAAAGPADELSFLAYNDEVCVCACVCACVRRSVSCVGGCVAHAT